MTLGSRAVMSGRRYGIYKPLANRKLQKPVISSEAPAGAGGRSAVEGSPISGRSEAEPRRGNRPSIPKHPASRNADDCDFHNMVSSITVEEALASLTILDRCGAGYQDPP